MFFAAAAAAAAAGAAAAGAQIACLLFKEKKKYRVYDVTQKKVTTNIYPSIHQSMYIKYEQRKKKWENLG